MPKFPCLFCVSNAGLQPSYSVSELECFDYERNYLIDAKDYQHHCWTDHIRSYNPQAESNMVERAEREYNFRTMMAL